jgi:hypothetical protein
VAILPKQEKWQVEIMGEGVRGWGRKGKLRLASNFK